MEEKIVKLSNGVMMPKLFQGLPLIMGIKNITQKQFFEIINNSINAGIHGFDTSHDYGNSEAFLGESIKMLRQKGLSREDFFIVTKIGNEQQYEGCIEKFVDKALATLQVDYIDLIHLHWPVPEHYVDNWLKLEKIYEKGKVRAIGIANAQVRHLKKLEEADSKFIPHVVQTEIHPFNSCGEIRSYCDEHGIVLQSCSSLCLMIEKVTKNALLKEIASKYDKSIAQVMLRWLLQHHIAPVFRAFSKHHAMEIRDLFLFKLSQDDMLRIDMLNENYRFHPESLNCVGY